MTKLTTKLKDYRIKNGLTQKELANKLDIAPAYISKIESGCKCGVKIIKKLADLFNVTPTTIVKWMN